MSFWGIAKSKPCISFLLIVVYIVYLFLKKEKPFTIHLGLFLVLVILQFSLSWWLFILKSILKLPPSPMEGDHFTRGPCLP